MGYCRGLRYLRQVRLQHALPHTAEAITSKFRSDLRGYVKKALRRAVALGLLYRKGGTKSYGLTKEGLRIVKEFCIEP